MTRTSNQIKQDIINLYQKGLPGSEIAKRLRIGIKVIYNTLKKNNIPRRTRSQYNNEKCSKKQKEEIINLFLEGVSANEIGKRYDISNVTVYNYIKQSHITKRQKRIGFEDSQLRRKYKITIEVFNQIRDQQDNRCAICKQKEKQLHSKTKETMPLAIDHDHKTGEIRGLLCDRCNRGLGLLFEDIKIIEETIKYIEKDFDYRKIKVVKDSKRKITQKERNLQYKTGYKISLELLHKIEENQNFTCKICHKPETSLAGGKNSERKTKALALDHNHKNGNIRGLLCHRCNVAMGMFEEDTRLLQQAKEYLSVKRDYKIINEDKYLIKKK
jgi:transposase-like protein